MTQGRKSAPAPAAPATPPVDASADRRRLGTWGKDLLAGLVNGVVSIPDGLASAALAGVNPIYGLYTSVTAPIAGRLLLSAQRMQIATTSTAALAAGEAIRAHPADTQADALFLLSVMVGVSLALFALLKVGRLVKYVSQSVMTGFLIGVAAVPTMDQLAPLAGYHPPPGSEPFQLFSLLTHLDSIQWQSLLTGLLAARPRSTFRSGPRHDGQASFMAYGYLPSSSSLRFRSAMYP